jgi:hypothetical protein
MAAKAWPGVVFSLDYGTEKTLEAVLDGCTVVYPSQLR